MAIDYKVFSTAVTNKVLIINHASSACAYPVALQGSSIDLGFLEESSADMRDPLKSCPDGLCGWMKLMGEYQLANVVDDSKTKGR